MLTYDERRAVPAMTRDLTDAAVIAAIRANHLKANILEWSEETQHWDKAWVDQGGSIWGAGPYVKLPVGEAPEWVTIRVYAPERLRKRLAARWVRG